MIRLEDFWRVDDQIKSKWGKKAYQHLNYCGLEPIRPPIFYDYFCTPRNTLTFAATGGDGVHFGFVNDSNQNGTLGPIVMTVPMAEINNVIVAENLDEFFSIGYYVGWFALEQIVYDLDDTINYYSKPDSEMTKQELSFLELLRIELSLKPVALTKERLNELEKKYFHRLNIGEIKE